MQAARIELLQRMAIFGGIRTETVQFLLASSPIVSVPTSEFFFREHDEGDAMFVIKLGKAAVLKSWHGQDCLRGRLLRGDGIDGSLSTQRLCPGSRSLYRNPNLCCQSPPSVRSGSEAVCAQPDEHGT